MVMFKTTHNTIMHSCGIRGMTTLWLSLVILGNLEIPGREKSYFFLKIKLFKEKFLECNFK